MMEGIIAFVGAFSFMFALKTERADWFLIYTTLFAICVAAVVII